MIESGGFPTVSLRMQVMPFLRALAHLLSFQILRLISFDPDFLTLQNNRATSRDCTVVA
jgi:hypothetical protein